MSLLFMDSTFTLATQQSNTTLVLSAIHVGPTISPATYTDSTKCTYLPFHSVNCDNALYTSSHSACHTRVRAREHTRCLNTTV